MSEMDAVELANKWDDAVFEMVADIESRIFLPEGKEIPLEMYDRHYQSTVEMREQREVILKALLDPAHYFTDPMAPTAYCEEIGKRLAAARAKRAEQDKKVSEDPMSLLAMRRG